MVSDPNQTISEYHASHSGGWSLSAWSRPTSIETLRAGAQVALRNGRAETGLIGDGQGLPPGL